MKSEKLHKLQRLNVVYFSICFGGLAMFFAFTIIPDMRALYDMHTEVDALNKRIEQQKIFFPAYQTYLREISHRKTFHLPLPQAGTLRREQISTITKLFENLVSKSGLVLIRVTPDYGSISQGSDSIAVKLIAEGDYFYLRQLLLELGNISYIRNLQTLRVQAIPNGTRSTLVFWIALDKTGQGS